jgi:multicomponent K+:H+ antiporter subunit G
VLILVFVSLTTPVTLMLLARAALYRDRAEKNGNVPMTMGEGVAADPAE